MLQISLILISMIRKAKIYILAFLIKEDALK
jgi:hypothetical protein